MSIPMLSVATAGIKQPSVKDMSGAWRAFMGIPSPDTLSVPTQLRDFSRVPADEAWVNVCVNLRAQAAASAPIRVQVKQGKDWVDWEQTDSTNRAAEDLQYLLDDVNPEWEGAQLQSYIQAGYCVHGGSYVKKVRGRLGGPPQELHWLPAPDVKPKKGRTFVETYEHRPPGGAGDEITAKNMIPFRALNLVDPTEMVSPLAAARYEITTNKAAAVWNTALLNNWGVPPGAWVADNEHEYNSQEIGLIRRALRALRGPGNAGRTPILPPLKWVPLSLSEKDADWIASRKVSRMAICAILGVPLVLAGDDEKSSVYASMRDAERVFWRRTMIPSLDAEAIAFNAWLTPEFDKTRRLLRISYDYSGIEALKAPPAEDMQVWLQAVDRGLPLNRFIAHFQLGEPVEGGDEPRFKGESERPKNNDGSEPAPRPEANHMQMDTGHETVRSLGKGLYKHSAVKTFMLSDNPADLTFVPQEAREAVASGLRRRYPAEKIAQMMEDRHE